MGKAQVGGLGGPALYLSFGSAPNSDVTVTGPPMQLGYSEFGYVADHCPGADSYTVVSGVDQNCDDSAMIALYGDNTPSPDVNGYMMLLHDIAHPTDKILYQFGFNACEDVDYQFSAAFINLNKPTGSNCTRFSSFIMEVRDGAGRLLGSTSTGDIEFAIYSQGYHFSTFSVNFRLNSSNTLPVTVKIIDEAKALSGCSNYIAIDDIQVAVTGSKVNIAFDSTAVGYWVKTCCFQENKSFTMKGTVQTNLANPAVQWEESTDEGITWRDIPGATGYVLTQNFLVPDTFLYRLRAADRNLISHPGCGVASELLRVQVDGLPRGYSINNNTPICAGDELKLTSDGGAKYEWHGPNGFFDNVKYAGIYNTALKDSGWYYATIYSYGGCKITDSTHVTIIGSDAKAGPDTVICAGEKVVLHANEAGSYNWAPATFLSDAHVRQPVSTPAESIVYNVTTTDKYGCTATTAVTVTVKNKIPVTTSIHVSKYVCRTADSLFFRTGGTGIIKTWTWDFGNGTNSNQQEPPVQYYNNIPFTVNGFEAKLTVTDTAGCSAEAKEYIRVEDMCNMAVPSAFTPNGDGLNDYFWPLNAYKAEHIHFVVFNRNGTKLFETRQWPEKWDGTYRGEPQDPGTYTWIIEYTDQLGKKQLLKGYVILIR